MLFSSRAAGREPVRPLGQSNCPASFCGTPRPRLYKYMDKGTVRQQHSRGRGYLVIGNNCDYLRYKELTFTQRHFTASPKRADDGLHKIIARQRI